MVETGPLIPKKTARKKAAPFIKFTTLQRLFGNNFLAGINSFALNSREVEKIKSFKLENGLDAPISVRAHGMASDFYLTTLTEDPTPRNTDGK